MTGLATTKCDPAAVGRPGSLGHRRLAGTAVFLPAVVVIGGWVGWSHLQGGYPVGTWYPGAIAAGCLLAVTAAGTGRILPPARTAAVAIAGLAALTAYSYLSMVWSVSPGNGWDASNKLLLLLAVAWTISLLPWSLRTAQIAVGAWALGVTAVCAISIIGAAGADDLGEYIIKGRYLAPIGYANALSALPAMAFLPALWLCARREVPAPLRVLFLTMAVFLAQFAALPQSRGAMLGLLVSIVVFLAIVPSRLRFLAPLVVVAGGLAVSISPIYEAYSVGIRISDAADSGIVLPGLSLAAAVDDAALAMGLTAAATALLGCLIVAADAGIRPSASDAKRARQTVAIVLAAATLLGLVSGAANAGRIADGLSDQWHTFKSSKETPATTGARLTARYSDQRYDYWRVALRSFGDAPIIGEGAGSFEHRYAAERRFEKPSKYTHDIWMRTLAEGGVVALLLLLVVLGAGATGLREARRGSATGERGLIAVCVAVPVYFFVHASLDWLEEFPALVSPALTLPFLALAATDSRSRKAGRSCMGAPAAVLAGLVGLAAVGSLALPYAAQRQYERGVASGVGDLRRTYGALDNAASLNPLRPDPHLRAGLVAVAAGDPGRARSEFRRSLHVEDNWYAHLELALLDSQAGRFRSARAEIARAQTLNAEDRFLAEAAARIRGRRRIDPAQFNRELPPFGDQCPASGNPRVLAC